MLKVAYLAFEKGFRIDDMVILGVQAGKPPICQQESPLNGEISEPAPQSVHCAFQRLLLLNGRYFWKKGKLFMFPHR